VSPLVWGVLDAGFLVPVAGLGLGLVGVLDVVVDRLLARGFAGVLVVLVGVTLAVMRRG